MKILFDDLMQGATTVPAALITAPLADTWDSTATRVVFPAAVTFDCLGIGNTDATQVRILADLETEQGTMPQDTGADTVMAGPWSGGDTQPMAGPSFLDYEYINLEADPIIDNGLYLLSETFNTTFFDILHNGTYLGRIAIGIATQLGCSPSREPEIWTTADARRTLSGQVVPGAGGITGRTQSVEVKYKIDRTKFAEIEAAFRGVLGQGYPVFIIFDDEQDRMPWLRLYATIEGDIVFQSSVNAMLYGKNFKFREAF